MPSGRAGNRLLVKDPVGAARPTVYDLPGPSYVYGLEVERDPNNSAAAVLQHWNVTTGTKNAIPSLDYITMNRNTARAGIITAKGVQEFRNVHPIRMKIGSTSRTKNYAIAGGAKDPVVIAKYVPVPGKRQRGPGSVPSELNPSYVYGLPSGESNHVSDLMTDHYQRMWIDAQEKREKEMKEAAKARLKKKHSDVVPKQVVKLLDVKEKFVLSKFKNVKSRIEMPKNYKGPQRVIESKTVVPAVSGAMESPPVAQIVKS